MFRRLRMLRNWGGIVDVTPDRSPIIGKTPVPGLFVNCGWGTGGFKATPGSGHVFAATIASGEPHPLAAPVHARPLPHRPADRRGGGRGRGALSMLLIPCPYCGDAAGDRVPLWRRGAYRAAARARRARATRHGPTSSTCAPTRRGVHAERWRHIHGCGRFFNCVRDTVSDRILATYRSASRSPRPRRDAAPMSAHFRTETGGQHRPVAAARLHLRRRGADRALPATRSPRRCSPMASISSGARSSITGRAASSRPAPRSRTRWSRVDRGGGRETPNLRATQVELYDGLAATQPEPLAVARLRSRRGQRTASRRCFRRASTTRPSCGRGAFWRHVYEPAIRRAAGLGQRAEARRSRPLPASLRPLRRAGGRRRAGGPRRGARGGGSGRARHPLRRAGGVRRRAAARDARRRSTGSRRPTGSPRRSPTLRGRDRVTLLPRTTAFGYYADNLRRPRRARHRSSRRCPIRDLPRERLWQVRAKEVVLATGAIERPLVFPENDRPGIMLADAARTYLNRYGVQAGQARRRRHRATTRAYRAALDLQAGRRRDRGDRRSPRRRRTARRSRRRRPPASRVVPVDQRSAARSGGSASRRSSSASSSRTARSRRRARRLRSRADVGRLDAERASLLAVARQAALRRGARGLRARRVGRSAQRSAGACRGTFDLASLPRRRLRGRREARRGRDARRRGLRASGRRASSGADGRPSPARCTVAARVERGVKAFVDFQNDVTAKDLKLAAREGFRSIEHVKRYTTTGMATDQGKTSNMNALAIVADDARQADPEVGLTTFRPPYTPVTFGALAGASRGDLFDPVRQTPIHDWAAEQGAVFEDVGLWKRARYFPQSRRGHARGGRARMPGGARRRSASSMPRRSARSRSSGRTPPSS